MKQSRDSHGRFKADHRQRNMLIGAATAIGAGASAIAAALHFGLLDRFLPAREGHEAPDLAEDAPRAGADGERAPADFRPDPTAPVAKVDREALRPATGPGPTITEPNGSMNSQTAPANG